MSTSKMSPLSMAEGQKPPLGTEAYVVHNPGPSSTPTSSRSPPPLTVAPVRSKTLCQHHMLISLLFVIYSGGVVGQLATIVIVLCRFFTAHRHSFSGHNLWVLIHSQSSQHHHRALSLLHRFQHRNEQRCQQEIEDIRRGVASSSIPPDTFCKRFSNEALDEHKHSV